MQSLADVGQSVGDAIHYLGHKGCGEELASCLLIDATLLHIEESLVIELSHRCMGSI